MAKSKYYPLATRGNPSLGRKYENCVLDVKSRGGAVNPWAVCRAQLHKKYGRGKVERAIKRRRARRNPSSRAYDPMKVLGIVR